MSNLGPKLVISASVIGLQSLVIWGLGVWSILLLFSESATSLASALFLIGLLLAAALWSSNIALGLFRLKRWAQLTRSRLAPIPLPRLCLSHLPRLSLA